jgi:transposase
LEAEIARLKKNSSNSSKPPSSDIVKPAQKPAKKKGKKRKRGGQPGHPRHERPAFAPEQVDQAWEYHLHDCPHCGTLVLPSKEAPRVLQQVEIVEKPITITEHRSLPFYCPRCRTTHYAPIEEAVRQAGLIGRRLRGVIAYLKGACHASFSTIRKFVRDVLGITISRGHLARIIGQVSASLKAVHEMLLQELPTQASLNVDETGHKDSGKKMWTWCFRAATFTLFKIDPSRSADVLIEVLGREFNGVLGCDYFSAYHRYMRECDVLVQFCLAHLIRDIKFLVKHPDKRNRAYGRRVLDAVRELFAVIHRRESMSEAAFADQLEEAGNILWGTAVSRVPQTDEAENLANRFEKHGESYIRFITTPGIEPTNNLAEQAIRFVVIDRKVTQGSRSDGGQRWLERIWTVIATCEQQGRSVLHFLIDAIDAYFEGQPAPSLVPDTS